MNKKITKKNFVSSLKSMLDSVLKLEANSTSCLVVYEPKQPKKLAKFKRKTK